MILFCFSTLLAELEAKRELSDNNIANYFMTIDSDNTFNQIVITIGIPFFYFCRI